MISNYRQGIAPAPDALSNDSPGVVKRVVNTDGTWYETIRVYNNTGASLSGGVTYLFTESGAASGCPQVNVPSASGTIYREVVVPTATVASATWFDGAVFGNVNVQVDGSGTNINVGDSLKTKYTTDRAWLVKDTNALSNNTVAIAQAPATTQGATIRVRLVGGPKLLG